MSLLGAGGMGQVYLARDGSLDRSVALKILPPDLVRNEERVRRFVQEAKSASSLSHPHIVAIYEIGEADVRLATDAATGDDHAGALHVHYIAMELVSGRTLRDLIHRDKTDLRLLVRYLSQAADGLAKAHAAGIVHRDLKPENIMVSEDGFAKVLDFGLAKLTESARPGGADHAATATAMANGTGEGVILGTVGYMSPEQVQGKLVDHRSDIFSFGCVLYEAATRQRPFVADSDFETLHKILKERPPPVEELNPQVPGDVRRLIRRCLAKSPDQRLQSMKDLALELAEIADTYDTLSLSSGSGSTATISASPVNRGRSRWELAGMAAVLVVGVGGIGSAAWMWAHRGAAADSTSFTKMEISRLASIPDLAHAALSPDGRYLTYAVIENGKSRLVVRQIATSRDLDVVPAQTAEIGALAFSPDGSYVFYRQQATDTPPAIYQVAALGGVARRILVAPQGIVFFSFCVSPDGARVATFERDVNGDQNNVSLVIGSVDGTPPRTLTTVQAAYGFAPSWSPDGREIVADIYRQSAGTVSWDRLSAFSAQDGREQPLGSKAWSEIEATTWLSDGSGILVTASEPDADVSQLWLVSWPGGALRRITDDANAYDDLSASADSATAAVLNRRGASDIWSAPVASLDAATRVAAGDALWVVLRNGSVLFRKWEHGHFNLWSLTPDARAPRRMTPEHLHAWSAVTASNADVMVFTAVSDDNSDHLWRSDLNGDGLTEVPGGSDKAVLALSPDGQGVYFAKSKAGGAAFDPALRMMPLSGGPEAQVGSDYFLYPRYSPNGKYLFRVPREQPGMPAPRKGEVATVADGATLRVLDVPAGSSGIAWAPSSDAVTLTRTMDGVKNIWRIPIDGGPARQVTHFAADQFGDYVYSADGSRLYFTRSDHAPSEVLLIKHFR